MGKYGYLKGPPMGCGTWAVLFSIFITSPIWIHLLAIPLKFLVFLADIGVMLFGEGNAVVFFMVIFIVFFILVVFIGRRIEHYVYQKKGKEDKER